MIKARIRDGYVLLVTVLVIGVMASASAIATILLGLSIERNAFSLQLSTQAFTGSWSCIEYALLQLKENVDYAGNEEHTISYAYANNQVNYPDHISYGTTTCTIRPVNAEKRNENITVCTEARFGNFTKRRLEVTLLRVKPDIKIKSWKEVSAITACSAYSPPMCGDNTVDGDEECDDGNTTSDDGCSSGCITEYCGDSIVQNNGVETTEECDAGSETASCDADCTNVSCGDGTKNTTAGEECDDGNTTSNDGCDSSCVTEECGDSVVQSGIGEQCDDGNTTNGDGCDSNCKTETCGNSIVQSGEDCDDGGESATCDTDCTTATCGDSTLNTTAGETCDEGTNTASCDNDCTSPVCGDNLLNTPAGEECDDGGTTPGDGCDGSCNVEACGNSVVDSGEQCDDGNTTNNDGCSDTCQNEICGDSITQTSETCDDGGVDTASCDSDCTSVSCGDSHENTPAGEECDDGNTTSEDGCSSGCLDEECGDSIIQTGLGEECDDGNTTSGDGCDSTCQDEDSSPTDYEVYWKFDESSGHATDSSGNGYTGNQGGGAGTSTDTASVNFTNTRSRDFDGSNDRITNSSTIESGSFSVSFWTKNDSSPSQWDGIACRTNGSNWTRGWGFFYNSSSQIRFFVENYSSYRAYASISPTQWNHIAGTWDGSTIRIYVNGTEGTSDSYSGSMTNTYTLGVGRCGNNYWNINGKVDDFRVYDDVLTPAEISSLAAGN